MSDEQSTKPEKVLVDRTGFDWQRLESLSPWVTHGATILGYRQLRLKTSYAFVHWQVNQKDDLRPRGLKSVSTLVSRSASLELLSHILAEDDVMYLSHAVPVLWFEGRRIDPTDMIPYSRDKLDFTKRTYPIPMDGRSDGGHLEMQWHEGNLRVLVQQKTGEALELDLSRHILLRMLCETLTDQDVSLLRTLRAVRLGQALERM